MISEKETLTQLFQEHGFKVSPLVGEVMHVQGNGIVGAFCCEWFVDDFYSHVQHRFIAENKRGFNKWSQTPLILPIEDAIDDFTKLLWMLKWLASDEGLVYSNTFRYLYDESRKLPYILPENMMKE